MKRIYEEFRSIPNDEHANKLFEIIYNYLENIKRSCTERIDKNIITKEQYDREMIYSYNIVRDAIFNNEEKYNKVFSMVAATNKNDNTKTFIFVFFDLPVGKVYDVYLDKEKQRLYIEIEDKEINKMEE